ncbi:TPA: NAD(P)/FAD-dependent oxidoreductase [Klebsiella quasipneumoniae subsp. quasipneumoniae]|uniref:NAD(P)/FAD-dependent oxidoreductase n=1 Tax=Klebsiella quasipneumoniae TaxID=1463165 RepID=UPI000E3BBB89|nr:NAD(P)/FAD-dependent oxidoreductase [Klebsiella quasipneumoniae]MDR4843154.1 NAD(P)/FAD-dependent oxidoreductase [Klebsiella quasipneumoniae]NWM05002.1 NAD(P)/FAD-dependent oxidoreductase [Klebsiella quasipneumoniae]HBW8901095.1 NAD(P)/FAD-dependent oxidoreductase [Klebsiella quasipneumoniae subsp. quasipneumoniae]HCI6167706.1 NAD(P)/FAD-dependent oxidoreductase [Klebsiella quasipneumoniae subsp. quasipneumoniae]HCI6474728.1 NAD(P)/FAD-dependent oxidoreductase [Klebsiella quasipneumoniae su
MERFDAIVVGAGAAGMFCAAQAGQLGCRVLLLDNGKKPGRKILMSGGGRCNFTNMYVEPAAYLSQNPHFCKSALARYTQWDFIELVGKYGIAWHEKTLGQLFCDDSAEQIVSLLLAECEKGGVQIRLRSEILSVERDEQGYRLQVNGETLATKKLVIASGGLSMPGLGASPFGYKIAEQFGLKVLPTRAGLVPFTLHKPLLEQLQVLSGVSVPSTITAENGTLFRENLLFTHRGLSGPAVLQISSYWQPGEFVTVNLLPDCNLEDFLNEQRGAHPNQSLKNTLAMQLPKRLVECLQQLGQIPDVTLKQLNVRDQQALVETLTAWRVQPNGTEGYRTAEVTLGGVDTNELSSRTMEARKAPGLYFIGEVMDVTGWLGGYNFQWAWSSAWACAQALVDA